MVNEHMKCLVTQIIKNMEIKAMRDYLFNKNTEVWTNNPPKQVTHKHLEKVQHCNNQRQEN